MEWSHLGLEIVFVNLGGYDSCGPKGRVGSFAIAGVSGEQARWATDRGARIGTGLRQLLQRYSGARFEGRDLVLVSVPTPFGESGVQPAFTATIFRGDAIGFQAFVGAGGE